MGDDADTLKKLVKNVIRSKKKVKNFQKKLEEYAEKLRQPDVREQMEKLDYNEYNDQFNIGGDNLKFRPLGHFDKEEQNTHFLDSMENWWERPCCYHYWENSLGCIGETHTLTTKEVAQRQNSSIRQYANTCSLTKNSSGTRKS